MSKIFECIIYGMLYLMPLLVLTAVTDAAVSAGIRVNIRGVIKIRGNVPPFLGSNVIKF